MTYEKYEVEFKATTYRTIEVSAMEHSHAEELAWENLYTDPEVSKAWRQSADIERTVKLKD